MAIFKNPPPDGFIYPNISEKKFLDIIQDLPSRWVFWYEPTIHGGQKPDVILWIPTEEFAAIFIIELKDWRRNYVARADATYVYLRNNRVEYNPLSKLKLVRDHLNEALAMHYRAAPGLEKIAVIPLLLHWGTSLKDVHPMLREDNEIDVIGKSITQDSEALCELFIEKAREFYQEIDETPPIVSVSIKRALFSCIDLSMRVQAPSGRAPQKESTAPTDSPIDYNHPISPLLDGFQSAVISRRAPGHFLLSGVPGTGKTIMLLGRMKWYSKHFRDENQLFIVHQKVLITYLKQKYRQDFNDKKTHGRFRFWRFKDWFSATYENAEALLNASAASQLEILNDLVNKALSGELPLKKNARREYGHIFVDEAHQMPTDWIKLLARFAKSPMPEKRNIWIAYDNGQGIYRKHRFEGNKINLSFRGRSQNFSRVYRCGMLPWVFAACCHPEAFFTYRALKTGEYLDFIRLGSAPLAIVQPTLETQAQRLAEVLSQRFEAGEVSPADVTIFYAVAGMSEKAIYPEQITKRALDRAFEKLGGIEWVAIHKSNANWTSNRVRACTFTSSQGIDAPVSVLFGAETFRIFQNSDWANPDALFYTVLTRSTNNIILTYKSLADDPDCRFQQALQRGITKARKILPLLEQLKPVVAEDGNEVYRIRWSKLDEFVRSGLHPSL